MCGATVRTPTQMIQARSVRRSLKLSVARDLGFDPVEMTRWVRAVFNQVSTMVADSAFGIDLNGRPVIGRSSRIPDAIAEAQ